MLNDDALAYIALIRSFGFDVYAPASVTTWCYFTDGRHVAYAQWGVVRTCVSSVHKANRYTGTGFQIADKITRQACADALQCVAPGWVSSGERASVRKYDSWEDFAMRFWCPLFKVEA
jgi:hypothetical protein